MYNIITATFDFKTYTYRLLPPTPFYNPATLFCLIPMLYLYIAVTAVTAFWKAATIAVLAPLPIRGGKRQCGRNGKTKKRRKR
tara:strand:- start:4763 stop:5011 length:249 start_codon:yes stop_codon:yes gene_type:complete